MVQVLLGRYGAVRVLYLTCGSLRLVPLQSSAFGVLWEVPLRGGSA